MSKPIMIIAEIAQAHDGSLGILHSYIDALADTGIDAIKFQTHIAQAESSKDEPFRTNFSYEDKTRFDYWKRMEFSYEQWEGIKTHCEKVGLEFMASPFSSAAVDILEKLNVKRYKIGSGETSNFLMLEKIAATGKPIILSSGMSSFNELDETLGFLSAFDNDITVLQCTTQYPTPAEEVGLNVISQLTNKYQLPVGLSDHSGKIYPSLAAVALGASVIEVHVTFDRRMFGPDSSSSLTIEEIQQLTEGIRFVEKSLNNPVDKSDNSKYKELKTTFGKSIATNKVLQKGHKISLDDLESKKPGNKGIPAKAYKKVIGKVLSRDVGKFEFLNWTDMED